MSIYDENQDVIIKDLRTLKSLIPNNNILKQCTYVFIIKYLSEMWIINAIK